MRRQRDPFRKLSDYIKGKTDSPGSLSRSLENFELPDFNRTISDFSFAELAEEHPKLLRELSDREFASTCSLVGGLLTVPFLQGNNLRLTALAHLALWKCAGPRRPKINQLAKWFDELDRGSCGRLEDRAEEVFVTSIFDGTQNYRLFEGNVEGNGFITQIFLDVLETMPDEGKFLVAKRAIRSLLILSEEIAARSGLPKYSVGNSVPLSTLPSAERQEADNLRRRVTFSNAELSDLGIGSNDLAPFIFDTRLRDQLGNHRFGYSAAEDMPLLQFGDLVAVYLPNCIGLAIRSLIIRTCLSAGLVENLEEALAAAHATFFHRDLILGDLRRSPIAFQRSSAGHTSTFGLELTEGVFLQFIFACDSLSDFSKTRFAQITEQHSLSSVVNAAIQSGQSQFSNHPRFRKGYSLVVACGWGRPMVLGLKAPKSGWEMEYIGANDLASLSRRPGFTSVELCKVMDSHRRIGQQGFELFNANGLLNLCAWIDSLRGHIVPHERLRLDPENPDGPYPLMIPTNVLLDLRVQAAVSADVHLAIRPDSSRCTVRRINSEPGFGQISLSPLYFDLDALMEGTRRCVYEGEHLRLWTLINVSEVPNPDFAHHLFLMAQHWVEFTARFLDQHVIGDPTNRSVSIHFKKFSIPPTDTPIPTEAEIASNISIEEAHDELRIIVGTEFVSGSRRPDNIAERSLVRALVVALLPEAAARADDIVQSIVRDNAARHFHAFAVPELRDYIKESLPEKSFTISRIDDAYSRIGLGWSIRKRSQGDEISGRDECCVYLNSLVKSVMGRLTDSLAQFDRDAVIELMLLNHESIACETTQWQRTFRAIRALADDADAARRQAIEQIAKFNAGSLSSRILIEIAVCVCQVGAGLRPNALDIGAWLADASILFHMGGYSDCVRAGVMEAKIRISPGGDVLMNHDPIERLMRSYGESNQSASLAAAADKYEEYYEVMADAEESTDQLPPKLERLQEPWTAEFGFSLKDTQQFGRALADLAIEGKALVKVGRSDFLTRIGKYGVSLENAEKMLKQFSLAPRSQWDMAPDGFQNWCWYPWRFRRQLSLIARPIVQLDASQNPILHIAPAMVAMHIGKFCADVSNGFIEADAFTSAEMQTYIENTRAQSAAEFNDQIASTLEAIGWKVRKNLSGGEVLQRRVDRRFGEIDVLAWCSDTKEVLVIECKDLGFDKTFSEIAWRLSKYRGEVQANGRRDELRRHLDRLETLKAELPTVSKFVGFDSPTMIGIVVSSQPVPMQFDAEIGKLGSHFVTARDITQKYHRLGS
ncbi:hypothetical protein [Ferrovibrio sp.]|uniref:hypothetical protein n=1 Tax=Ferrovibrio sp. TaxID=1917215 RepID=UPI0035B2DAFD